MPFEQYLILPTIIELKSDEKEDAFKELTQVLCKTLDIKRQKQILEEIEKREEAASTFVGQGVAIPQAKAPIKEDFAIVVGRSLSGIKYDAARGALAYIIVLVVSKEIKEDDKEETERDNTRQLQLLAEIAAFFKNEEIQKDVLSFEGPLDLRVLIQNFRTSGSDATKTIKLKYSSPVITAAINLAKEIKASAIMVFADTVKDNDFLDMFKSKQKLIIVSSNKARFDPSIDKRIAGSLQAPSIPASRTGQMKIGILLALSCNLISKEDRVVCISGNSRNGVFDTIVTIDVAKEYEFFFTSAANLIPPDVKPEVLERIIGLAGEIAVEGREGKPVGTIFVVGDTNSVNAYVRQLIINPFRGYSEAERNILDPGLEETIKEFASIDGAFIITGDGIVLSAGSYLKPQSLDDVPPLPSGYGSRHLAGAAITACTNALAITISESTGTITIFRKGAIIMSISKPISGGKRLIERF